MYLINGQPGDTLSVNDRGLHYGDGLFETLAVQHGNPLCWERHYRRLAQGCDRLHMQCPEPDLLLAELGQLAVNTKQAVLKIIITRGAGGRGYRIPAPGVPVTRILGIYPWPSWPEKNYSEGVTLEISGIRLGKNTALAGIKHLNRLEQVLAGYGCDNAETAEVLMLDTDNNVIEGSMSNIFIVSDNILITPDVSCCGIAGVIRGCILDLAPDNGISSRVKNISESELYSASEIFLCNSVIGLWPVQRIAAQEYRPGGPVTRKIHDLLHGQQMIVQ